MMQSPFKQEGEIFNYDKDIYKWNHFYDGKGIT